jgi:hypothetical protein
MSKYIVKTYGWSFEAIGITLTDEQVKLVKQKMEDEGYDELHELRFELDELLDIDIWDGDLFHITKPFDNYKLQFEIEDESGNTVKEFLITDTSNPNDVYDNPVYTNIIAFPTVEGPKNIFFTVDENKGGIFEFEIESDEIPNEKDFSYIYGSIETPNGDWDFIDDILYKNEICNVIEYLDNTGKSSTTEIFTLNDINN